MRNDKVRDSRKDAPEDIGTLWSMARGDHRARCVLMVFRGRWEIRVLVDGTSVLSEHCSEPAAGFVLAEKWKRQMFAHGWRQVMPPTGNRRTVSEPYYPA